MNAVAIQYIWQAIQESERSDELRFMDDKFLAKTAVTGLTQPRPNESGAVAGETVAKAVITPKLAD